MKKAIFGLGVALIALAACGQPVASDARADEAASPTMLLGADGIMTDGTPASRIPFGANSLDTVEAVMAVAGETYDQDSSEDCGAGPMEFADFGRVVLNFQQGEFVGWELREAQEEPWIGTPGGVTIGSPHSDLEAALGATVTVEQSSIGTEFNGGGFSGLLSSDAPDATVTALWAGTSCIMR